MATARWTPAFIERMFRQGDYLADGAVRDIYGSGDLQKVNSLIQSLIENDQELPTELPDYMRRYLEESDNLPTWIEPEVVAEGQRAFKEYGFYTFMILGCASLPEDYVLIDATRVLGRTQQLKQHVERRVWETALFLIDTMDPGEGDEPGGLEPDGRGIRTAQRVRLMHAAVRHLLLTDPSSVPDDPKNLSEAMIKHPWKDEYGAPINQVAMAAAYLSFSYIVIKCLEKMGVMLTSNEIRGWLHCWNVIGYIMGVDEDMLLDRPETMEQAGELYNIIWNHNMITDKNSENAKDGAALSAALIKWMEGSLPGLPMPFSILRRVPRVMTRFLIGKQKADILGVKFGPIEGALLGFIDEVADLREDLGKMKNPVLGELAKKARELSAEMLFNAQTAQRGKRGGTFRMPEHLAQSWGVQKEFQRNRNEPSAKKTFLASAAGSAVGIVAGIFILGFVRKIFGGRKR